MLVSGKEVKGFMWSLVLILSFVLRVLDFALGEEPSYITYVHMLYELEVIL